MADLTNLKLQIVAAIRANGQGAITGPLLQEQLLDMVDAMEVDTWGGFITAETVAPSDITHAHLFLAVTAGTYEAFDLTVEEGDIWVVAREADGEEWTKTNLAAGLKEIIATLSEGKQNTLTEGNGIAIENDTISVKVADDGGIVFDNEGNAKLSDDIPTTQDVETYISEQKGAANGIAPLDENGLVDKTDLPEDTVYFEEGSETEVIDELRRLLAELYQGITDLQGEKAIMEEATRSTREATNAANTATSQAEAAAQTALRNADTALTNANRAAQAAQAATQAALDANTAASNTQTAIVNANNAAELANTKAGLANDAATLANQKAELADQKATLANTKAEYADEQGDYAKQQGDYAKDQIDYAKGDFESLDARMDHIDEISVTLEEESTPADTQLQNEYEATLARAYQAITELKAQKVLMQTATAATEEATEDAETAAVLAAEKAAEAQSAAQAATTAAGSANSAAGDARVAARNAMEKANLAEQAAQDAQQAMDAARGTYPSLADRLTDMQADQDKIDDDYTEIKGEFESIEASLEAKIEFEEDNDPSSLFD